MNGRRQQERKGKKMEPLNVPWGLVGIIWIINFGISWLNARTVGVMWVETKCVGGWQRFMAWMGAIMSASGFTWCYMLVLLFGTYYAQPMFIEHGKPPLLDEQAIQAGLSLGYLILIPGILFSGLMIWVDSLIQAWRRRDLPSMGVAAWNTFAQAHNTYSAMRGVPEAMESVFDFFGSSKSSGSRSDGKGQAVLLLIVLVVLALISGVLTTWSIINHYAGTRELEQPVRV